MKSISVTDDEFYRILKDIRARIVELASARLTSHIMEGSYAITGNNEEQIRAGLINGVLNLLNRLLKNLEK